MALVSDEVGEKTAKLLDAENTLAHLKHFVILDKFQFTITVPMKGDQNVYPIECPDVIDELHKAVVRVC